MLIMENEEQIGFIGIYHLSVVRAEDLITIPTRKFENHILYLPVMASICFPTKHTELT